MRTGGYPNNRRHKCRLHREIFTSRSLPSEAARDRLRSVLTSLRSVAFPGRTSTPFRLILHTQSPPNVPRQGTALGNSVSYSLRAVPCLGTFGGL